MTDREIICMLYGAISSLPKKDKAIDGLCRLAAKHLSEPIKQDRGYHFSDGTFGPLITEEMIEAATMPPPTPAETKEKATVKLGSFSVGDKVSVRLDSGLPFFPATILCCNTDPAGEWTLTVTDGKEKYIVPARLAMKER